MTVEVISIL